MTDNELQILAKAVFGAAAIGSGENDAITLSVLTMVVATAIHHVALNQAMDRTFLVTDFVANLLATIENIDQKEQNGPAN